MNNRVCVNGSPLDRRHDTLALAARRSGYDPTLFGYTDQSADPRDLHPNDPLLTTYEGLAPGFSWRASIPDHQWPWLSWLRELGYNDALTETNMHIPEGGVDDPPKGRAPKYKSEHTETAFLVDEFKRWLNERVRQQEVDNQHRWFAHVSFLRPHPPFTVPPPYDQMVSAADVGDFRGFTNPDDTANLHPLLKLFVDTTAKKSFIPGADGLVREWTQQDLKQIAATYFGMVSEVDAQIGRMMDALKEKGHWNNTVIIFTSDHGEQLGDHTLLGKYGFFDSSYHIPLIVRDPVSTSKAGRKVDSFTEAVDIFPTLMDRLSAEIPSQLDGRSLMPFVQGETPDTWRDAAHWEYDFRPMAPHHKEHRFGLNPNQCNMSVLRNNEYKYVHFSGLPPLLFNLQEDPGETKNLAGLADVNKIQLECAENLLSWRAEHLDQSLALSALTPDGLITTQRTN